MKKSCGGCRYFIKLKNSKFSGGFCEWQDARTNTDHSCDNYRPKPYDRIKQKEHTKKILAFIKN